MIGDEQVREPVTVEVPRRNSLTEAVFANRCGFSDRLEPFTPVVAIEDVEFRLAGRVGRPPLE